MAPNNFQGSASYSARNYGLGEDNSSTGLTPRGLPSRNNNNRDIILDGESIPGQTAHHDKSLPLNPMAPAYEADYEEVYQARRSLRTARSTSNGSHQLTRMSPMYSSEAAQRRIQRQQPNQVTLYIPEFNINTQTGQFNVSLQSPTNGIGFGQASPSQLPLGQMPGQLHEMHQRRIQYSYPDQIASQAPYPYGRNSQHLGMMTMPSPSAPCRRPNSSYPARLGQNGMMRSSFQQLPESGFPAAPSTNRAGSSFSGVVADARSNDMASMGFISGRMVTQYDGSQCFVQNRNQMPDDGVDYAFESEQQPQPKRRRRAPDSQSSNAGSQQHNPSTANQHSSSSSTVTQQVSAPTANRRVFYRTNLRVLTLQQAENLNIKRTSLTLRNGDDWRYVLGREDDFVKEILKAFDADWQTAPDNMTVTQKAKWNNFQEKHERVMLKLLDKAKPDHDEAAARILLHAIIDAHRNGGVRKIGTASTNPRLNCTERIEQVCECIKNVTAVRADVMAGKRLHELAANPLVFGEKKMTNALTNDARGYLGRGGSRGFETEDGEDSGDEGDEGQTPAELLAPGNSVSTGERMAGLWEADGQESDEAEEDETGGWYGGETGEGGGGSGGDVYEGDGEGYQLLTVAVASAVRGSRLGAALGDIHLRAYSHQHASNRESPSSAEVKGWSIQTQSE